jgi:hypothetical protein
MKRLWLMAAVAVFLGCEAFTDLGPGPGSRPGGAAKAPETPKRPARPRGEGPAPAVETYAVCQFDILTVPRAQIHELDQLYAYTETGGIFGPGEKILALNGLRMARLDMRFREAFAKELAVVRKDNRRVTWVRLPEGRDQVFDVGGTFKEVTLFTWTAPDAVVGRHFAQARYSMTLSLEKVTREEPARGAPASGGPTRVEYGLSWQAHTGAGLQRAVTIPALDVHAQLEEGQSLIIAPAGFGGRSVDRAFLSGVDEAAVQVTLFVITPTEIRRKPEPRPAGIGESLEGETIRQEKAKP